VAAAALDGTEGGGGGDPAWGAAAAAAAAAPRLERGGGGVVAATEGGKVAVSTEELAADGWYRSPLTGEMVTQEVLEHHRSVM
jgi:hypothetical protein